jgi:hypothetical protein
MIEKNVREMYVQSEIKVKKDHKSFPSPQNKTENAIVNECNKLIKLLIDKNRSYGNSALDPVRTFSNADNIEQLKVRIDDKLSRFQRGKEYMGDNDIDDLMGYLVLLKIAMKGSWK